MVNAKNKNLLPRPPIVVVMGHIDHGKTTLLSYIRKTKMPKEPGEITQSIGAYEIIHPSTSSGQARKITFIDTPGHEVFSKIRKRGAQAADLGILVVAADEGVKIQTREAIKILQESKTPFIVAINKIDKPNADIERVKQELAQADVLLEGFGGNISWQAISAKTGEKIDELLDLILLAADIENLTYDSQAKASGVIIESKMDSSRGLTIAAIVRDGILRIGDEIITPSAVGKIKILENFLGKKVDYLEPSSPALILGFGSLPQVGEEFWHPNSAPLPAASAIRRPDNSERIPSNTGKRPEDSRVNFILKADVSGSLEALSGIIKTFPNVKIINESVGDITDGDVKLAFTTNAIVIGFKSRINRAAENLAKSSKVKIITSEIIYELLKNLETKFKDLQAPAIKGNLEILAVFGKKNSRQIVGGRVLIGVFKNNLNINIQREERTIGKGKIVNVQKEKRDVVQIKEGEECGVLLESDTMVNVGDQLIFL